MKRGLPRPRFHVDETQTMYRYRNEDGVPSFKELDPKWANRDYPMPYTAGEYISSLSSERLGECHAFKKCIVCGEHVDGDIVHILLDLELMTGDWIFDESGPFHEKCAVMTYHFCPHINMGGQYEFALAEWKFVRSRLKRYNNE